MLVMLQLFGQQGDTQHTALTAVPMQASSHIYVNSSVNRKHHLEDFGGNHIILGFSRD